MRERMCENSAWSSTQRDTTAVIKDKQSAYLIQKRKEEKGDLTMGGGRGAQSSKY